MTKKRFERLCRAYFTRLNEWAKENGRPSMNMGRVYRCIPNISDNLGEDEFGRRRTREEWWNTLTSNCPNSFGVGIKSK